MPGRTGGTLTSGDAGARREVPWEEADWIRQQLPSGRHGLSRDAVVTQQRDRILRATIDVVARRGYHQTCVDLVTGAAAISRRTFYDLYVDKEDSFRAAYAQAQRILLSDIQAGLAAVDPARWSDRLMVVSDRLAAFAVRDPAAAQLLLSDVLALGEPGLVLREATLRPLADVVAEAPGSPPPTVVAVVVGGACEVVCLSVHQGRSADLPHRLSALAEWVAAGWGR